MPKHAEVIYETGAHSVVSYDDLDELKTGLKAHHRRAVEGDPGSAQDWSERSDIDPEEARGAHAIATRPAERVKRVFLYDEHPGGNDPSNDSVDANTVNTLVAGMTQSDGKLPAFQLISALRDELSPVHPTDQGRHESMYKADGEEMTDLSFLDSMDSDS